MLQFYITEFFQTDTENIWDNNYNWANHLLAKELMAHFTGTHA